VSYPEARRGEQHIRPIVAHGYARDGGEELVKPSL
jgi:hypothetical protein